MNQLLGKILVVAGLALAGLGLVLLLCDRPGFWQGLWQRLPLGRLPGDIRFQSQGVSFFFPWVSCLVLSAVVSLLAWFFRK